MHVIAHKYRSNIPLANLAQHDYVITNFTYLVTSMVGNGTMQLCSIVKSTEALLPRNYSTFQCKNINIPINGSLFRLIPLGDIRQIHTYLRKTFVRRRVILGMATYGTFPLSRRFDLEIISNYSRIFRLNHTLFTSQEATALFANRCIFANSTAIATSECSRKLIHKI